MEDDQDITETLCRLVERIRRAQQKRRGIYLTVHDIDHLTLTDAWHRLSEQCTDDREDNDA